MKIRKYVSALLAVLMIASALCLTACGKPEEPEDVTTPAAVVSTGENPADTGPQYDEFGRPVVDDEIPDTAKFTGETLKILARSDASHRWEIDFWAENENGVKVNDAVYKRNEEIKERLDINISVTTKPGSYNEFNTYATFVTNSVNGGSHAYDLVGTYSLYGAQYATQGYFRNVNGMSEYLHLDKVWWNQALRDDLTIENKLFLLVGDTNLTTLTRMLATYFNKKLVSEKFGDLDLYSVVKEGKWTIDYFTELIAETYTDVNGDGKADDGDGYGLISVHPSEALDGFQAALDVHVLVRDSEGNWMLNENTDRIFSAVEKTSALYLKGSNTSKFLSIENCLNKFAGDTAMFMIMTIDKTGDDIVSNMTSQYGILPLAKYDEDQEKYYTIPQDAFNFISVVTDTEHPDMVAAALELMSAGSYKGVTPLYFDEVLKYRYMSDSDSGIMLDYLRDGLRYDFATINTLSINDCGRWFRNSIPSNNMITSKTVSASFKAMKKNAQSSLDKLVEAYKSIDK